MKKRLKITALFGLFFVLQSCQGCDCFSIPSPLGGRACGDGGAQSQRLPVSWGIKLQIGDYVLDSIMVPGDSCWVNSKYPCDSASFDVTIVVDSLATKVPNYREAAYIGKVYEWNSQCRDSIFFGSGGMLGGGFSFLSPIDHWGGFDFSQVLNKDYLSLNDSIAFAIFPSRTSKTCFINHLNLHLKL